MKMDGWADYLHTSFHGEHVLFPGLRLTSLATFICAALIAAALCILERYVIVMCSLSFLNQCTTKFSNLCSLAALVALPRCPQIPLAQGALAGGALRSRDTPSIVRLFLSLFRLGIC